MNNETRILVFAKAPVPGEVKTRLIPALGAGDAARLHALLLRKTLSSVVRSRVGNTELWCAPDVTHGFFQEMKARFGISLRLQRGDDLGGRMSFAFENVLEKASSAVLVGSDCAELSGADLRWASEALKNGCEAVLGPAEDGGYVLIGLSRPFPELFVDMPWGTENVLEITRERLRRKGWRWRELPVRHDVDRPEDLERLMSSMP